MHSQESGPTSQGGSKLDPPSFFSLAFAVGVICFPVGVQPPQPPPIFTLMLNTKYLIKTSVLGGQRTNKCMCKSPVLLSSPRLLEHVSEVILSKWVQTLLINYLPATCQTQTYTRIHQFAKTCVSKKHVTTSSTIS